MQAGDHFNSLGARVARGATWIGAARFAASLLGFASMIVVARLLTPEDFGLIAVAVTAMQLMMGVSDIGLSQAVVRFRDAGRDELDTLFTFAALRGAAIAALMAAAGPFAAVFFNDDRLIGAFLAVALYPLLGGLANPRFYEFERAIDFSREFVWTVVSKLVSVAAAVAAALLLRNYWAVISGLVTLALAQLALSYTMRPYRPRLTFASWRRMLGFSGWLAGVSFLAALNNKIDAFIVARLVGPVGAGNFYYGSQLAELPTREFATPIARAVYPGLSELQAEQTRMQAAFLKGVEALGAVAMPLSIGFAFVAADAIALLLGEKWLGAVLVVEVLTPVLGVQTLFLATQYYAMALGLTRLVFIRELIFLAVRFPVIIWATAEYGLVGAVYALAGCGLAHVALNLWLYMKIAARPAFEPLLAARRSLAAVAAMAAYFLLLRPEALADAPAALRLGADIAAGGLVYAAALIALWRLEGAPDGAERRIAGLIAASLSRRQA